MIAFYKTVQRVALVCFVVITVFPRLSESNDCEYIQGDECNSSTCGLHLNNSCGGALCSCRFLNQSLGENFLRSLEYGGRPYQPECDKNPPLFEGASTSKLGTIKLEVYKFKGYFRNSLWVKTAFNISFTDVKWTTAHIRFQNLRNETVSPNLFHKIFTRRKEDNVTQFFYDCLWSFNLQKKVVRFQYEAHDDDNIVEIREYRFEVPPDKEVDIHPFMCVDVTDHRMLTLWVQGHSPQNYSVVLLQDDRPILDGFIAGRTSKHLISYSSPPLWPGVYNFKLQILGQNKTYFSEPRITVEGNNIIVLVAGVVVGMIMLSFLLVLVYIGGKPKGNPSVLITYAASSDPHVQVIRALTKYLQDKCNIVAYLDDKDIPASDTEDPLVWYVRAFTTVKYVMVISSPPKCSCSGSTGVTYRNMDVVAQYLIRDCIGRGLKSPKIFCVTLPYSDSFPTVVSVFQKFDLLNDMDYMLKFLHEASCLQFQIPGGKKDLAKCGQALSNAIKEAQQSSSKCMCGGKQEVSIENDAKVLLSRLAQMQLEDSQLFEYNAHEDKPSVSNIPYLNFVKTMNLSGKTYTEMPRNKRVEDQELNIRSLKL